MTLMIATPLYEGNQLALGYHEATLGLVRGGAELAPTRLFMGCDVIRARSRALHMAYEKGFDHLLFWDADVQAPPEQIGVCLRAMIDSGHDLIGAPYPKKRIYWEYIEAALKAGMEPTATNLERAAYEYPVHGVDVSLAKDGCTPAKYLPMGFTLLTKKCIRAMVENTQNAPLKFRDYYEGAWHEVVAAFALIINQEGLLLSEDHSFCERAGYLGIPSWLYVGDGSRLQHVGGHKYGSR